MRYAISESGPVFAVPASNPEKIMATSRYCAASHSAERSSSPHQTRDLAWWLDQSIPLPGGYRIGFDGIIGLIPGVGDALSGGLSSWIIYQSYRRGVPKLIILRMMLNVLVDVMLGAIPVFGDLFDFMFKANLRNMRLLADYQHSPQRTYRRSAMSSALFIALFILLAAVVFYAVIALAALIWRSVNGA